MLTGGHQYPAGRGWAGYSPPDDRTVRRILVLMGVLGLLFLLDILTTQAVLWMGGVELNPFMAGIVTLLPLHLAVKTLLLLLVLAVSLVAEQRVQGSGTFFYGVLIALYCSIVLNNLLVLLPRI